MAFMDHMHPQAFKDWPKPKKLPEGKVTCAQCRGYGGWNLELNAYSLQGYRNTAKNRHLFSHFRCHCMNCNGWGYVDAAQGSHVHDWQHVRNTGNCLNLHRCTGCGREWEIDSSD